MRGRDLKDTQHRLPEGVKVTERLLSILQSIKLATKDLHPQQSKDNDEEKEEDEKTGDRSHGVDERDDQIPQ